MFEQAIRRLLHRRGYIALSEVSEILARVGSRMAALDEHLAREYVIDPMPGGIRHKISLMCQQQQRLFEKVAAEELQAARDRIAAAD